MRLGGEAKGCMRELALFAGAGGGILGGKLLGWRTVCAVEWEPYAAGVLLARQNDGTLEAFPVWDDVQTFDGRPWRGRVDVVSGGFPCQDISTAGKGAGIDGERSGMWKHMARVVGEVRPRFVFVENSPALTLRGLGTVLGDLAALGFDAAWQVLSAADLGAPHVRERLWLVAHAAEAGRQARGADSVGTGESEARRTAASAHSPWVGGSPAQFGMADGVANRTHRLAAAGNGQVPRVAAAAFTMLARSLTHNAKLNGGRRPSV